MGFLFGKKKNEVIDIRDLYKKRGIMPIKRIQSPDSKEEIKTDDSGFVDFAELNKPTEEINSEKDSPNESSFFGFMGNSSSNESFSSEKNGYDKREVDVKIEELDNKIYKLEQRIEVLERKNSVGGW
jgi:hypothetical protein